MFLPSFSGLRKREREREIRNEISREEAKCINSSIYKLNVGEQTVERERHQNGNYNDVIVLARSTTMHAGYG